MYNSSQYCHTNSHLNKEKISVGGSLKKYHCKQCHLSFNGFVNGVVLRYEKYVKAQHNQALTLGLWVQWPGGPVDLKTYWPPKKLTSPGGQ